MPSNYPTSMRSRRQRIDVKIKELEGLIVAAHRKKYKANYLNWEVIKQTAILCKIAFPDRIYSPSEDIARNELDVIDLGD